MPIVALLLSLVGAALLVVPIDEPLETPDGRTLSAAVGCHDGEAVYYRPAAFAPLPGDAEAARRQPERERFTDVHELAHALDCLDDGVLNGSPGHPRPSSYREALPVMAQHALPFYCWFGADALDHARRAADRLPEAEWYACMVRATDRVR